MIYDGLHSTDKRENPRKNFGGQIIINQPMNTRSTISTWTQNISVGGIQGEKLEFQHRQFKKGIKSDLL